MYFVQQLREAADPAGSRARPSTASIDHDGLRPGRRRGDRVKLGAIANVDREVRLNTQRGKRCLDRVRARLRGTDGGARHDRLEVVANAEPCENVDKATVPVADDPKPETPPGQLIERRTDVSKDFEPETLGEKCREPFDGRMVTPKCSTQDGCAVKAKSTKRFLATGLVVMGEVVRDLNAKGRAHDGFGMRKARTLQRRAQGRYRRQQPDQGARDVEEHRFGACVAHARGGRGP